jgi:hypothetical protein
MSFSAVVLEGGAGMGMDMAGAWARAAREAAMAKAAARVHREIVWTSATVVFPPVGFIPQTAYYAVHMVR